MGPKRAVRIVLPILLAIVSAAVIYLNASVLSASTPHVKNGVLNLGEWNQKSVFAIIGEWEFYWDKLLTNTQIKSGSEAFVTVNAPGEWNYYETGLGELPGFGRATYRVYVTGAQPGEKYGLRIQNQASAYRLYVDGELLAQNGSFGDKADAPASAYRPQLADFTPQSDSFDIILQISNYAYAGGGMWEPVIFGTAPQADAFDSALSAVSMVTFGGIAFICMFFIIFYWAQRWEKDVLILAGIGGYIGWRLKIPAGAMVGSMFAVAAGSLLKVELGPLPAYS
ncbi:MAG TPA: hypothetical protein PLW11_08125, partial [Bacillota bacterium]|nr:hypothetical protein [Bacillota bacterium]